LNEFPRGYESIKSPDFISKSKLNLENRSENGSPTVVRSSVRRVSAHRPASKSDAVADRERIVVAADDRTEPAAEVEALAHGPPVDSGIEPRNWQCLFPKA